MSVTAKSVAGVFFSACGAGVLVLILSIKYLRLQFLMRCGIGGNIFPN